MMRPAKLKLRNTPDSSLVPRGQENFLTSMGGRQSLTGDVSLSRGTSVSRVERQSLTEDISLPRGTSVSHRGRQSRTGDVSRSQGTSTTDRDASSSLGTPVAHGELQSLTGTSGNHRDLCGRTAKHTLWH